MRGGRVAIGLLGAALALPGCAGTLTVQQERQIGRQVQSQLRREHQFVRDPLVVKYVRDMGRELVEAADPSPFRFRFYVIEDEDPNAFAVPGGAIYIHTGLMGLFGHANELAGTLAHEIGHVTSRHLAEQYSRRRNTGTIANILAFIAYLFTGNPGVQILTDLGAQAYLAPFSQEQERVSDRLAVDTMIRAGWDPEGVATAFESLLRAQKGGFHWPQFLQTHPATTERIQTARNEIAKRGPLPPHLRRDDDGTLRMVQKRIERLIGSDGDDEGPDEEADQETND